MSDQQIESRNSETSLKRGRDNDDGSDTPSKEVFVNNLPYNIPQAGLEAAMKRIFSKSGGYIGVRKFMAQKGFAILNFETHEDAVNAVSNNQDQKLGPRKLFVQLSDPAGARAKRFERENEQRNDGNLNDTHPNPDCWFCLANPKMETQAIFAVDEEATVYMNVAKGPISKYHTLMCPVTHYGCFAQAPEKVRVICNDYANRFVDVMNAEDKDVIRFERWIPLNSSAANHMQIHLVPIDRSVSRGIDWKSILVSKGKDCEIQFMQVRDHDEVVEKMKGILGRVSYLYISIPDASGSVTNWLGMGKMSFQFPREIICSGLNTPEKVDWKACQQEKSVEEGQVEYLKSKFNAN